MRLLLYSMLILFDKDNQVIYNTLSANNLSDVDFSKVAKVYTMPALPDWTSYEDNKAYNGTLTIKNESGHVLATMNLSMTKVLPTGIPEGFSIKTAQVAEGIYNCYMIPDTWAASQATEGTMEMSEIFNFGKGTPAQYNISFATSTVDNNNKPAAITVKGDEKLVVNKDYINNNDKHVTTVVYNYGKISSVKEGAEYVDVTRAAAEFQTIYNCIYNNTYSWHWATAEELKVDKLPYSTELTYGTDADLKADTYIYGVSTWDGRYSAFLNDTYKSSLVIEDATLTSDANGEEEYFDVEIADGHIVKFNAVAESSTTNPTAPVQSTLTITAKDMYGHDVVIKLPMTVTNVNHTKKIRALSAKRAPLYNRKTLKTKIPRLVISRGFFYSSTIHFSIFLVSALKLTPTLNSLRPSSSKVVHNAFH